MILFTSVTKRTFAKGSLIYLSLTIFLAIFNYIYEQFSYGESSVYMRLVFLIPLMAAIFYLVSGFRELWVKNRLSLLLFNSGVATSISGCLIKGIIEISGRSTVMEVPYWYATLAFFGLSFLVGILRRKDHT